VVNGRGLYCLNVGGVQIDAAVTRAFLEALTPAALQAVVRAAEQLESDRDAALGQWRLALERARYAAQCAERRYRAVDPENRLVARGLEAEWEHCLGTLATAEAELERRTAQQPRTLSHQERQLFHIFSRCAFAPIGRKLVTAQNGALRHRLRHQRVGAIGGRAGHAHARVRDEGAPPRATPSWRETASRGSAFTCSST
jgi:hypothetical protein